MTRRALGASAKPTRSLRPAASLPDPRENLPHHGLSAASRSRAPPTALGNLVLCCRVVCFRTYMVANQKICQFLSATTPARIDRAIHGGPNGSYGEPFINGKGLHAPISRTKVCIEHLRAGKALMRLSIAVSSSDGIEPAGGPTRVRRWPTTPMRSADRWSVVRNRSAIL